MVNLLPEKIQRSLTRTYYARLLSLSIFFAALAVFASAAFLVPSYLRATAEADATTRTLQASQQALNLGAKGGTAGEFSVLTERVAILKTYMRPPEVADVLSLLTRQVPKGVSVSKITITPGDDGAGSLSLTGKADTRTDLLAYVAVLQGISAFKDVSVPVEALASEVNVDFTLSFSFDTSHS